MFNNFSSATYIRNPVNFICLDFQEAFDKVPHNTQIQKRVSHGTADSIVIWIEK